MPKNRNRMQCHGLTDLGLKRSTNQDHFLVAELRQVVRLKQSSLARTPRPRRELAMLLAVADGMGGMADGAEASRMALETLLRKAVRFNGNDKAMARTMRFAAQSARRKLAEFAAAQGVQKPMGTTLTAAHVSGLVLDLLHVGDSRCYLLRRGKLQRLTIDHTIAQRLKAEGALNEAQAAASPFANVLWNSISSSTQSELSPEVSRHELRPGDVLMLCTDGLTKHLDEKRLAQVLKGKTEARGKAEQLVAEAREKGGTDNITVIVAQVGPA
ncbi:MAG: serine/threonine-protein phosphatase [Planctomycetes bacterium]|nr:serine/threonine-protein phosphatase [Planctomycetota bacterium]